jgi:hypothetical protein
VPSNASSGQYAIQITFDMGPLAGKVTSRKEFDVGK